mmetsp:Transcript_29928/g.45770  ORF Transcript_29928/g.45770 Transcript_29928/m.45770 type:complete len:99 (-) Transcript_29928:503-799(-)
MESFKLMYKQEGVRGFFKGNGATVVKIAPFSAFQFFFYEFYKNNLYPGLEKKDFTYGQKLICGAITGITASTLTYPIDIVKTYLTINLENEVKMSMYR